MAKTKLHQQKVNKLKVKNKSRKPTTEAKDTAVKVPDTDFKVPESTFKVPQVPSVLFNDNMSTASLLRRPDADAMTVSTSKTSKSNFREGGKKERRNLRREAMRDVVSQIGDIRNSEKSQKNKNKKNKLQVVSGSPSPAPSALRLPTVSDMRRAHAMDTKKEEGPSPTDGQ